MAPPTNCSRKLDDLHAARGSRNHLEIQVDYDNGDTLIWRTPIGAALDARQARIFARWSIPDGCSATAIGLCGPSSPASWLTAWPTASA